MGIVSWLSLLVAACSFAYQYSTYVSISPDSESPPVPPPVVIPKSVPNTDSKFRVEFLNHYGHPVTLYYSGAESASVFFLSLPQGLFMILLVLLQSNRTTLKLAALRLVTHFLDTSSLPRMPPPLSGWSPGPWTPPNSSTSSRFLFLIRELWFLMLFLSPTPHIPLHTSACSSRRSNQNEHGRTEA